MRTHTHRRWGSPDCQRSLQPQWKPVSASWSSGTSSHSKQRLPTGTSSWCRYGPVAAVEAQQISPPPGLLPSPLPRPLAKRTQPLLSARPLLPLGQEAGEVCLPSLCKPSSECEGSPGSARLVWGSSVLQMGHEAHPLPLPLVPQDWVLSKQGTKSSMIFLKCYLFPWEEQVGFGSQLGFGALQKSTIALFFLKSPHLQDNAYVSVHSSGCGLHSIKRSQTEHLQTSVFREGFLPDSPRAASCLAAPACVPCHKRWQIFKSCLFNFETQPFLLWDSGCI